MEGKEGTGETDTESGLIFDWAELTHECLINILSRLTFEHRWTGPMLVCKPWLNASKDPSLNSVFDLETRFDSSTESTRWWAPEFERRIDSMLRSVISWSNGNLTEILTRHCSDISLNLAAQRCPNLQVLSIKSCPHVTDASMAQIAYHCRNLKQLDISYCHEISHESLVLIGRNCPNLTVLKRNLMNWLDPSQHVGIVPDDYLNAVPQEGDTEAAAIGKYMPQLEHLEIGFSKLSAKGLGSICEGCLKLEYLDLSGCANLTSRDIINATSNLKDLKSVKKPDYFIPRSWWHSCSEKCSVNKWCNTKGQASRHFRPAVDEMKDRCAICQSMVNSNSKIDSTAFESSYLAKYTYMSIKNFSMYYPRVHFIFDLLGWYS